MPTGDDSRAPSSIAEARRANTEFDAQDVGEPVSRHDARAGGVPVRIYIPDAERMPGLRARW